MSRGDFVLMARRRAGLSQRQLAERLGCRQATIARWERGDRAASFADVQEAVAACGLQIDARLAVQDRSWWPQIALQLDMEPAERVRRLTPHGAPDALPVLRALAHTRAPAIVIGELADALHGSPLVLGGTVEICVRSGEQLADVVVLLGARHFADGGYEPPAGGRLLLTETPPGTAGYRDLARGAEMVDLDGGAVQVASLVDLIRIADASVEPDARRQALACRAVLDVRRARQETEPAGSMESDRERIERWLSRQTPVA
jgi:transcriptional regulator with XRE-family HTH domain